jgi:hypothetical protein
VDGNGFEVVGLMELLRGYVSKEPDGSDCKGLLLLPDVVTKWVDGGERMKSGFGTITDPISSWGTKL